MDKQLLERAKVLKVARDKAAASLLKMEEKKAEVKASVFQKVHAEYEAKLAEARKDLSGVIPPLQNRARELQQQLKTLAGRVEELGEKLDEVTLRHHIGEIAADAFGKLSKEIEKARETAKVDSERSRQELDDLLVAFGDEPGFPSAEGGGSSETPESERTMMAPPSPEVLAQTGAHAASHAAATGAVPAAPHAAPAATQTTAAKKNAAPAAADPRTPPMREQIEEALGDPFAEVASGGGDKPFFTNPILLVTCRGDETSYLLDLGELSIGRSAENDIILDDDATQARHAIVKFEQDHYVVQSLVSDGQLFVNDKVAKRAALADGDRIRIGKAEITFRNVRFDV